MPKTTEDKVEERVRKRLREVLSSAGVNEQRVALEILYLLPVEFVRMYTELYDRAHGENGAKAGADEGRIKRSGQASGAGSAMKTRKMSGAEGGGKRHVVSGRVVRDEEALDEKMKLDRKLVRAVQQALSNAGERRRSIRAAENQKPERDPEISTDVMTNRTEKGSSPRKEQSGNRTRTGEETAGDRRGNSNGVNKCGECGKVQAGNWIRCPFH